MEQVWAVGNGSVNHQRMNTTKKRRREMLKRLLMIGALCVGLMALGGTDANAWPASSSGWGATQNTVTIWSGWKGISNVELKPTTVKVILFPHEAMVLCKNNGSNDGGVGNPFLYPTTVTGNATTPRKAIKNGNWNSYITFTDEELLAQLPDANSYCINPNWTVYGIVVKTFDVYLQAYEDISTTMCPEGSNPDDGLCYTTYFDSEGLPLPPYSAEEVVHIQGSCDLGSAPIGAGSSYTCTTSLQWEWSKRDPTCSDQFSTQCIYEW